MFYLNTIEQLFLLVEQLDQLEVCLPYSRLPAGIPILTVFQNLRWNSNKTSLNEIVAFFMDSSVIIIIMANNKIKVNQIFLIRSRKKDNICCLFIHQPIWQHKNQLLYNFYGNNKIINTNKNFILPVILSLAEFCFLEVPASTSNTNCILEQEIGSEKHSCLLYETLSKLIENPSRNSDIEGVLLST